KTLFNEKEVMNVSLFAEGVSELHRKLQNKEISATDLLDASDKRIAEVDDDLKAFLTLNEEEARQTAQEADKGSYDHPLSGIPYGTKDNIVTKGLTTTASSRILSNFEPLHEATVIERLKKAGAVNVGKLNLDEFAMGSS